MMNSNYHIENNSSSPTAVLLAGGEGTRIRSLFPDQPKPLIEVNGQPFLYWVTAYLAARGLSSFVYSAGYKGDQIETWCVNTTMKGLERQVCRERSPLGTGGGLLNCINLCSDWVLVSNGDSLCLGGVGKLLKLIENSALDGGLIGVHSFDTASFGSLKIADDGRLLQFNEKIAGSGFVNAGTYLFRKQVLEQFPQNKLLSIEYDLIPELIAMGNRLQVIKVEDAPFIDIGTPDTVVLAKEFVQENKNWFVW